MHCLLQKTTSECAFVMVVVSGVLFSCCTALTCGFFVRKWKSQLQNGCSQIMCKQSYQVSTNRVQTCTNCVRTGTNCLQTVSDGFVWICFVVSSNITLVCNDRDTCIVIWVNHYSFMCEMLMKGKNNNTFVLVDLQCFYCSSSFDLHMQCFYCSLWLSQCFYCLTVVPLTVN